MTKRAPSTLAKRAPSTRIKTPCLDCGTLDYGPRCRWHTLRRQRLAYSNADYRRRRLLVIGGPCELRLPGCSGIATTADHVRPVARGGVDGPLRGACLHCNSARGDRDVSGVGGRPVRIRASAAARTAPWADWYGSPLTGRGLAKLLGPYRVMPSQRRVRGEKSRGYFAVDFADAWARYVLLPSPAPGTSGTNGTTVPLAGQSVLTVPVALGWADVPDVPDVPSAEVATPTETIPWRVPCRDYTAHQSAHRIVAGAAICDACAVLAS